MRIFFSVGEPSGDLHGANLIQALREQFAEDGEPECEFVGYGGPKMAAAGCQLHADLTQLAVMWFLRVLLNLHTFVGYLRAATHYFRDHRPDAVVLIDYPGFNWWIARRAKKYGIPVVYYGTPQLWAWASYRIKRMRRYVDHALCKLPFEEKWFRERGCRATHVGHPYFDELRGQQLDRQFLEQVRSVAGPLVTILPGSRTQEVEGNLEAFLKTAARIAESIPNVRFAIAAFKESHAEAARQAAKQSKLNVQVEVGRTAELIHAADCCLACSGSVSLELLYHAKPSVIHYSLSRISFLAQPYLRKVRYITLVNLMTAENPFSTRPVGIYDPSDPQDAHVLLPEYLTCEDRSQQMAEHIVEWLTDRKAYERRVEQLSALREQVGGGGASRRAAAYIAEVLRGGEPAAAIRSQAGQPSTNDVKAA